MEHFYAVVSEEGFDGVSLAKVAARMEVNPSLLIHYYGSREQMVLEFVDFIIERYERVYINILKELTSPKDKMELLMDRIFARDWGDLVGDRAFYECYALSLSHPEIRDRFRTFYGRFRNALAEELKSISTPKGLLHQDPESAADLLIVILEGKDFYNNITPDEEGFSEFRKNLKNMTLKLLTGK